MSIIASAMNWLNEENEWNEIRLQRDGVYALLSWRDFNRPSQVEEFSLATAAWIFILVVGLPALVMF